MRLIFPFLFLVFVNGAIYVFLTRPTSKELERLELRQRELDGFLAVEENNVAKWGQLAKLVETAQSVLEPFPSREGSTQSRLRNAFLEAEKGLGLRRDTLEFRPDTRPPSGFGGIRIRVIEVGQFADIVTYLHRISQRKIPMVLEAISLEESAKGTAPLVLTATFSALWPEDSDS